MQPLGSGLANRVDRTPSASMARSSPGSMSRTNEAPTMSSAAVSDATTQPRSSRPRDNGRTPYGSRAAYNVFSSMNVRQNAPRTVGSSSSAACSRVESAAPWASSAPSMSESVVAAKAPRVFIKLGVGKLESRIIIDSLHLGRYIGMRDLMVEAPPQETNNASGGTTESGISGSHGLVFTGTPKSAHFDKLVSVSVDLSMAGDDKTTLVFTPTGVLTGPNTANQKVPDDKRDAVLAAFAGQLPDQRLPFGVAPTSQGARGSEVIIEGITTGLTITLDGFNQA